MHRILIPVILDLVRFLWPPRYLSQENLQLRAQRPQLSALRPHTGMKFPILDSLQCFADAASE